LWPEISRTSVLEASSEKSDVSVIEPLKKKSRVPRLAPQEKRFFSTKDVFHRRIPTTSLALEDQIRFSPSCTQKRITTDPGRLPTVKDNPKNIQRKVASRKNCSELEIKAYHDSITTTHYGVIFFHKFNLVLNALDNQAARNHVNLCTMVLT
jgi:hypothetical protein